MDCQADENRVSTANFQKESESSKDNNIDISVRTGHSSAVCISAKPNQSKQGKRHPSEASNMAELIIENPVPETRGADTLQNNSSIH